MSMEEISVGHCFGERGRKDLAGESCANETKRPAVWKTPFSASLFSLQVSALSLYQLGWLGEHAPQAQALSLTRTFIKILRRARLYVRSHMFPC